jgi:hypothetical protein
MSNRTEREAIELCVMAKEPTATPLELIGIWNRAEQYPSLSHSIRCHVIGNPNCPEYIMEIAMSHEDEGVRAALASNEAAGKYFEILAMDVDSWPRRNLVENPCVPQYILEYLSDDSNGYVRLCAKRNLVLRSRAENV